MNSDRNQQIWPNWEQEEYARGACVPQAVPSLSLTLLPENVTVNEGENKVIVSGIMLQKSGAVCLATCRAPVSFCYIIPKSLAADYAQSQISVVPVQLENRSRIIATHSKIQLIAGSCIQRQ